jgi:flagellar hook-associated protein FlgK
MNNEEFRQASHHIGNTYVDISNSAQKTGADIYKNINNWIERTTAYLKEANDSDKQLADILQAQRQAESRNLRDAVQQRAETPVRRR